MKIRDLLIGGQLGLCDDQRAAEQNSQQCALHHILRNSLREAQECSLILVQAEVKSRHIYPKRYGRLDQGKSASQVE